MQWLVGVFGSVAIVSLLTGLVVLLANAFGWPSWFASAVVFGSAMVVVVLFWQAMRQWAFWVVKMAWVDWFSDPCGHAPACPACNMTWDFGTRCCGHFAMSEPPAAANGSPLCPECGTLDPVYSCCGEPWVRRCAIYVDGHGIMAEGKQKVRPAMWPNWRPSIGDFVRSVFPRKPY